METIRIKLLKEFIRELPNKSIWLQEIIRPLLNYYYLEIQKEYDKLEKHPYPDEYELYQKDKIINSHKHDLRVLEGR